MVILSAFPILRLFQSDILVIKDYILPFVALLCVIVLFFTGPIPQDPAYHHFADQRSAWGIPNFLNVISNLPFALVGLLGLKVIKKAKEKELKVISYILFTGFILLIFGSGYYHLWPTNETLVYDRIPMAIIFMSFFAFFIYDFMNRRKVYTSFIY